MQDYASMVHQLMGLVQPIGDVIPFRRQSIEPGMGLTEGAGRMGGNKGGSPVNLGAELSARNRAAYRAKWAAENPERALILGVEDMRAGRPVDYLSESQKYQAAQILQDWLAKGK